MINRNLTALIAGAVLAVMLLIYGLAGITNVKPGFVALPIKMLGGDRGIGEPLGLGTHWIDPIRFDVKQYDTRSEQMTAGLEKVPAATEDGQPISVDLSIEKGLIPDKVPNLHVKIGENYYQQVVYPALRSAIRNSTTLVPSDVIYTGTGRQKVQDHIQQTLDKKLAPYGIVVAVNLRELRFTNQDFNATLEEKAKAAQQVVIEKRRAEAAENTALKMANLADGEKQKRIKAAEADREERRLRGEGDRLEKEEQAKGILAVKTAEAEGARLLASAYASPGAEVVAQIEWAKNLGPNVKAYGFPTGAPGTSTIVDLNSVIKGALSGGK